MDHNLVRRLIESTGEDPDREGLSETPARFAKAWSHWTSGYGVEPKTVLKSFGDGAKGYEELVFQTGIAMYSLCEHHLAPFFGVAHIAYIPNGRVVGLSKLVRLVDVFARRLQVQERLCGQVVDALMEHLQPKGAAVVMQCRHLCMESRGVQKPGTITVTSAIRGSIRERPEVRAEFMGLVNTAMQGTKIL